GGGVLAFKSVSFDYASPSDLLAVSGTVVAAVPLGWAALRFGDARAVVLLRRVQSGSVNDYAGYLIGGLVALVAVLAGAALFA
ncbi:MAG: hypothetical protein ACRDVW_12010, partial [Acidimicrobiales bacterium]